MEAATCVNSEGRPKASYVSEHAAKAALERSPRWRRRATWPVIFKCYACHRYHLTHGETR